MCALIAAGFYAATFLMRTMVPLRVFGILSALFFMAYGALGGAITTFLMYLCLLPINSVRLYQIVKLVKKARVAVQGDLAIDWLKPFMDKRSYRKGDILFRKGQVAKEMFLTTTGKYLVTEIGVELPPGTSGGRTWLSHAQQQTHGDGRMPRGWRGALPSVTTDCSRSISATRTSAISFYAWPATACCRTMRALKRPLNSTKPSCERPAWTRM